MQKLELKSFIDNLDNILSNESAADSHAIFLIVIDNLPMLNLGFGHCKTNEIITVLQAEIAQHVGKSSKTFRIESDQIAIIMPETAPPALIATEVDIKKTIRNFGASLDLKLHIAASLSYAITANYKRSGEDFLAAIYHDTFFKTSRAELLTNLPAHEKSQQEMIMANKISEAISGNDLRFAYQPIIDANTGAISHYEALLRLQNDAGELESAGMFIPIAERMGFIDLIDHKTLKMAIAKLTERKDISIAINISHLTIGNRDWLKTFFSEVTTDIAKRLIVEITETAANHNLADTAYFVATLQEAGCQVALDDFGSGHTSYRQVRALSVDMVKIDGSLILDIETNTHNQILVEALVKYFKEYGLKTVAEFVDSGSCSKFLTSYGIDYLQGNYFGAAGPIES